MGGMANLPFAEGQDISARSSTAPCQAETTEGVHRLWGKSKGLDKPYPLLAHLLDTAGSARAILRVVIPPSLTSAIARLGTAQDGDWIRMVEVLASWHDVGKASCGFQNYDRSACPHWALDRRDAPGAGRHDLIGARLVWDRLESWSPGERARAAQIVGGHHGVIPNLNAHELDAWGGAGLVDRDPPPQLLTARDAIWEVLDTALGRTPDVRLTTPVASISLAIVVLADWVASSSYLIAAQQESPPASNDPSRHMYRAYRLASDFLQEAGLACPPPRKRLDAASLLGRPAETARWTPLQASINKSFRPSGPGIAVICAPTGEGKTEAALIAASRLSDASGRNGLFFAMPTVATAEGLYDRLDTYLQRTGPRGEQQGIRRVHSQSLLYNDTSAGGAVSHDKAAVRAAAQWMVGTRKALLAPFGVGTVDQVLLSALQSKHLPVRLLGTALGTLVIDEAHSLDAYMRKLLCRSVEWLAALGTPVVVLSATLSPSRAAELFRAYQSGCGAKVEAGDKLDRALAGYPAWASWTADDGWCSGNAEPRRRWKLRIKTRICPRNSLDETIAQKAVEASTPEGCVLVVRSTVAAAQSTYRAIRRADSSLVPGRSVEIIHSRLPQGIRRTRSEALLRQFGPETANRPIRMILVATQVVEQSFDVDFDLLITDPAPLPALLQRAGRVRRHRPPPDGGPTQAEVVWPTDKHGDPIKESPIYSKADLMGAHACITQAESANHLDINVPADVPELIARADLEGSECFDFADKDISEAEEATLAQLVRIDADRSFASRWTIPPPRPDEPLARLTGNLDTDEPHPGTRHQANSVLVVPAERNAAGWELPDGSTLDPGPASMPPTDEVRVVFDVAIPVSYPLRDWTDLLTPIEKGWDRTPVAGALLLDTSEGGVSADLGGYFLELDPEVGLIIGKLK